MMAIKEKTQKLFSVSYEKSFDDDNVSEAYENLAEELINSNGWSDVYDCWYDYLINECKTEEDVLNFANLFWCYEGYNQIIPNAVEFSAFFYAKISFENHPEAISVIDGIAWYALVNSGIISEADIAFEDFVPNDIPAITEAIDKWKEKGNGLH